MESADAVNGYPMSTSTGFASLFPSSVKCASTTVLTSDGPLGADEQAYISGAIEKRQMEFATGRKCAVAALKALGIVVPSLGRRDDRLPDWPPEIVGSITHCDGLCAAAVSAKKDTVFLGIDAEPNEPLPPGLLKRIASDREQSEISSVSGQTSHPLCLDRTLFSAKECLFKALYPTVGYYFGFEQVEIGFDVEAGGFHAALSQALQDATGLTRLSGRFAATAEHTMTAIQVER